jgi:hypothetical protein
MTVHLMRNTNNRAVLAMDSNPPYTRVCLKFIKADKLVEKQRAHYVEREVNAMRAIRVTLTHKNIPSMIV